MADLRTIRLPVRFLAPVGVILLSLVVAAAVLFVVTGRSTDTADSAEAREPAPQATATAVDPGAPSMLFIGDSYTVGPTSEPDRGYACLAANKLGWNCNVGAQAGTGYISGGKDNKVPVAQGSFDVSSTSFAERIPRLRELYRADVVVLDGGRNDVAYGEEFVGNAFVYTLQRVRQAWPGAKIVVVAPWFMRVVDIVPNDQPPLAAAMEARLRSDPAFADVQFIKPGTIGWFAGEDVSPYMDPDDLHPNKLGYEVVADKLAAALESVGVAKTQ